jgi:hypothetical protein
MGIPLVVAGNCGFLTSFSRSVKLVCVLLRASCRAVARVPELGSRLDRFAVRGRDDGFRDLASLAPTPRPHGARRRHLREARSARDPAPPHVTAPPPRFAQMIAPPVVPTPQRERSCRRGSGPLAATKAQPRTARPRSPARNYVPARRLSRAPRGSSRAAPTIAARFAVVRTASRVRGRDGGWSDHLSEAGGGAAARGWEGERADRASRRCRLRAPCGRGVGASEARSRNPPSRPRLPATTKTRTTTQPQQPVGGGRTR